jgi:hypothetical protein
MIFIEKKGFVSQKIEVIGGEGVDKVGGFLRGKMVIPDGTGFIDGIGGERFIMVRETGVPEFFGENGDSADGCYFAMSMFKGFKAGKKFIGKFI